MSNISSHPPTVDDATPAPTVCAALHRDGYYCSLPLGHAPPHRCVFGEDEQGLIPEVVWEEIAAPRLPEGSTEPEPTSEAQLQGMLSDFRVEAVARVTHPTPLGRFRATVGADLLERRILAHVTDVRAALTLANSEIETLREAARPFLESLDDEDMHVDRHIWLWSKLLARLRTLTTETVPENLEKSGTPPPTTETPT